MDVAHRRREAGAFLRERRGRLRPEAVGLVPTENLRRVPGLRCDEVARLAGVSVEYLTRLEQGRGGTPSAAVLEALASTLHLGDAERSHLADLLRTPPRAAAPHGAAAAAEAPLRPAVRRLLEALDLPALAFGRATDVVAWNPLAAALLTDFGARPRADRNLARLIFLDAGFGALMVDWEEVAAETVGVLRLACGAHPEDRRLAAVVEELTVKSPAFRRHWDAHEVRRKAHGPKRIQHPVVGRLELEFQALALPGEPDVTLVTYYPAAAGSAAETSLALLRSVAV